MKHRLAHIELEKPGSVVVHDILGADWPAKASWQRIAELFAHNTLADRDGRWNFIVKHDDMKRMQTFLRPTSIAEGRYRYVMRGSSGSFTAELELVPHCFGYGTTQEEARERLRTNLPMFIDDAPTARLEKAQ